MQTDSASAAPNPNLPLPVTAGEISRYFTLSDDGRVALDASAAPDDFAQGLAKGGHYPDAVQVIAHYLPKRQAVFWAMTCVRVAVPPAPQSEAEAALRAAERWIADPTEEHRAAALKAADAADAGTAAGCTALAAYYSEGLPKVEDVRTNARAWFLTAKLVSSAVMLAATSEPERMAARFREFVDSGLEIVRKSKR